VTAQGPHSVQDYARGEISCREQTKSSIVRDKYCLERLSHFRGRHQTVGGAYLAPFAMCADFVVDGADRPALRELRLLLRFQHSSFTLHPSSHRLLLSAYCFSFAPPGLSSHAGLLSHGLRHGLNSSAPSGGCVHLHHFAGDGLAGEPSGRPCVLKNRGPQNQRTALPA
jgi:hypothetical protein